MFKTIKAFKTIFVMIVQNNLEVCHIYVWPYLNMYLLKWHFFLTIIHNFIFIIFLWDKTERKHNCQLNSNAKKLYI